jgi:hypothetical protein
MYHSSTLGLSQSSQPVYLTGSSSLRGAKRRSNLAATGAWRLLRFARNDERAEFGKALHLLGGGSPDLDNHQIWYRI